MNSWKTLVAAQIVAHLSLIPMIMYGELKHYVIAFVVYFFTGGLGMAITSHRWLSHRSWDPPVWFQYFGTLVASLGMVGSPLAWVAIHRKHHRYTDKKGDPHSPVVDDWLTVQYKSMATVPELRYIPDLLRDPLQKFFHRFYWGVQMLWVAILYTMVEPFAVVYMYLIPAAFLWNMGGAVNIFCHIFGYRNYECTDQSKNNPILGILFWGEGWHNNHHANPKDWNYGHRWFEFDIGGWIIYLLDKRKSEVPATKEIKAKA